MECNQLSQLIYSEYSTSYMVKKDAVFNCSLDTCIQKIQNLGVHQQCYDKIEEFYEVEDLGSDLRILYQKLTGISMR